MKRRKDELTLERIEKLRYLRDLEGYRFYQAVLEEKDTILKILPYCRQEEIGKIMGNSQAVVSTILQILKVL